MKKYQIVEISENYNHAGTKATQDIAEVADVLKYERILIRMNTTKERSLQKYSVRLAIGKTGQNV